MHDDFYAHVFIFSKNSKTIHHSIKSYHSYDNIEELHNFKAMVEAGA